MTFRSINQLSKSCLVSLCLFLFSTVVPTCSIFLEQCWQKVVARKTFIHHKCTGSLLELFFKTTCHKQSDFRIFYFQNIMHFLISDSSDGAVTGPCVCLHACDSVRSLYLQQQQKNASVPSFTCDNGSWNYWWQPCCFSRKRDGPSSPLIGREVEWHLYYGDAKYTMVQRHNVEALHSLFSSVTLSGSGGAWGDSYPRGRQRSYVRKFSFIARAYFCWDSTARHSFVQQLVLLQLDV